MVHAVRSESYFEINNLYTKLYMKRDTEIILMYQASFGKEGFRSQTDLYFVGHDGRTVANVNQ